MLQISTVSCYVVCSWLLSLRNGLLYHHRITPDSRFTFKIKLHVLCLKEGVYCCSLVLVIRWFIAALFTLRSIVPVSGIIILPFQKICGMYISLFRVGKDSALLSAVLAW
jgi:hypothetical protein